MEPLFDPEEFGEILLEALYSAGQARLGDRLGSFDFHVFVPEEGPMMQLVVQFVGEVTHSITLDVEFGASESKVPAKV